MENILSTDNLMSLDRFNFLSSINSNEENCPYESININCKYYDENTLISTLKQSISSSLLSLNIQSLPSKFSEFSEFINSLQTHNVFFEIIALQEIFQIHDPLVYSINNYHEFVFKQRKDSTGGGVGFYIHSSVKFKILEELSLFHEKILETLFIEVELSPNNKFIIGNFYRPPSRNVQDLELSLDKIQEILIKTSSINKKCILVGDFNLCLLNHSTHPQTSLFIDTLFSSGYLQTISYPTRVANGNHTSSASLIDHCWTSDIRNSYNTGIVTLNISDHHAIFYDLNSDKQRIKKKEIRRRIFNVESLSQLEDAIQSHSFNDVFSCNEAQSSYNIFHDNFYSLLDNFCPLKSITINKRITKIENWMTNGILKSRQTKLRLGNLSVSSPSVLNKKRFKDYKNLYNKVIRLRKRLYFSEELILAQGNLKKTWEIMREATGLKKSSKKCTEKLIIGNSSIEGSFNVSEAFNNHFCSIAEKIRSEILPTDKPPDYYLFDSPHRFTIPLLSPQDIIDIVSSMEGKPSQDYTGLSAFALKKIITSISLPLSHILNLSIQSGVVPSQFKLAKVTPIFKKGGSETCVNDYRPVSLLSIFSKILEKHVCKNLKSYLIHHNILDKHQFGFQNNHSTIHPMIKLLNKVSEAFQKKEFTVAVFCDLRKAFDLCPVDLILLKLEKYGIRGSELEWFKSYLTERKQFVSVDNTESMKKDIKFGVPQGSILGPILFLLFFNDMPRSTLLYTLLFCDDTTLLASGPDLQSLIEFVNKELRKVSIWFRTNKMSLHPEKTKFTIFHTTPHRIPWDDVNLFIDDNEPNTANPLPHLKNRVSCISPNSNTPAIKFLGVYFDPGLNFRFHISQLNIKLSKSLFLLRRAKFLLNQTALKALYYSTFHCHLIYGLLAYSCASKTDLNSITLKQKKAIRCIMGANYNEHTNPFFKELLILPFELLIKYFSLQFMADYKYGRLPRCFENLWPTRNELNPRFNLRNANDFHTPACRTSRNKRLPLFRLPSVWNGFLNNNIKDISSKQLFKLKLKLTLRNEI